MTAHEGNINIEIQGKQNRCFPREQSLYTINKIIHNYYIFSNVTRDSNVHWLVNNFRDVDQARNI